MLKLLQYFLDVGSKKREIYFGVTEVSRVGNFIKTEKCKDLKLRFKNKSEYTEIPVKYWNMIPKKISFSINCKGNKIQVYSQKEFNEKNEFTLKLNNNEVEKDNKGIKRKTILMNEGDKLEIFPYNLIIERMDYANKFESIL